MGPRSDHQAGRSYGRRGQTPVIGAGQRFRCNVTSTLGDRGDLAFAAFRENFAVPVFLRFLGRLPWHGGGRKVFLIVDRPSVHKVRGVTCWLAARANKIALFLLPGCSPELNPDELLNQNVKTNVPGPLGPGDPAEMPGDARAYLRRTQKQPRLVRRYFPERHVRYAAA